MFGECTIFILRLYYLQTYRIQLSIDPLMLIKQFFLVCQDAVEVINWKKNNYKTCLHKQKFYNDEICSKGRFVIIFTMLCKEFWFLIEIAIKMHK